MGRLVKGGKYVFGWSIVGKNGSITVPPEAGVSYGLHPHTKIYVLPGSKTSKGFAITTPDLIKKSVLVNMITSLPDVFHFKRLPGGFMTYNDKTVTWSKIDGRLIFRIEHPILEKYSVHAGDRLLAGRGSRYALAFIKEGKIIEEALKHPELPVFG
ncbi:MAG: hypothetical protein JW881_04385 [Spirochaetales bacterium]|nr:hypothetical protein [Spirochaetales bacterium]